MTALELLLLALATYRVVRLVTRDEITRPLRERVLEPLLDRKVRDARGLRVSTPTRRQEKRVARRAWLAYLATCPHCLAIWAATGLYVVLRCWPGFALPVVTVAAVAGAASLLLDRDR